ncbi:MAG: TRAP transporter substrate-binding protein DctP [Mailhella sp.]|nr:TRAP transporter substrate-binding protein DctP [Mailhella sp.]
MKKSVIALMTMAMLAFGSASAEAKITLKVANSGPDTPENRTVCAADVYTDMVSKATNGEVELVFYHASKLGGEAEALEGIQMGTIEMGTLTTGPAAGFFPQTMVFDIPYLISSNAAGWEFFKSDFIKNLSEEFCKKTGIRILAIAEHGYRHFTAKGADLRTPADMKGLKIRVMENPAHIAMTRGLGATPTPISYSELYMALQQGVVDGMECPIANIHDNKFYEVQTNMVLDGHLYGPLVVFINEDKFQSLSKEQQDALYKGAEAFCVVHAGITGASDAAALKDMADKGLKIYQPTPEEQKMFRDAAQPAALEVIADRIGKEWVDGAVKAADEAARKVAGKEQQMMDECIKSAQEMVKAARGK